MYLGSLYPMPDIIIFLIVTKIKMKINFQNINLILIMFLSFFIFIFSFIQIISKTNYGYKEIISDLFREEKKIARNKTIINLF